MSMKKLSKKMLAVVAAGAMTMGLAMPAFAADAGGETKKVTQAYISKTYNTEVGKAMKFNFTAEQDTKGTDLVKSTVACTIPSISFTENETGTTKQVSEAIKFDPFKEAGKYEYTVKETTSEPAITDSNLEKLIMSKAEYKMTVYVVEDPENTFKVDQIVVNRTKNDKGDGATGKVDISGDKDKNTFNFVNTYVQEAGTGPDPTKPDPTYTDNGALKVSKTIDASEGSIDSNATFNFTATFAFPEGTDATTLGGVKGNGADVTLTEGVYKFTLKHRDKMKFTGLPVGTTITVKETGAANYKGSASVVLNGATATTVAAGKYHEDLTAVNGGKLGQKTNTVDVTNTYNHVPTTGIIMNTLPYVLMIALCGAALFGFVAFKRRR
ncbi:hypothetical protein DWY56_07520 [Ruminococcus sp. AF25-3LB]|nr:hypothetical protein DWY56_07520 [Ruminococcus sp. AF25-3LB]RGG28330.1 hypothetical protein DWY40_06665 [Ruminococcus sp. AF25-17]